MSQGTASSAVQCSGWPVQCSAVESCGPVGRLLARGVAGWEKAPHIPPQPYCLTLGRRLLAQGWRGGKRHLISRLSPTVSPWAETAGPGVAGWEKAPHIPPEPYCFTLGRDCWPRGGGVGGDVPHSPPKPYCPPKAYCREVCYCQGAYIIE